MVSKRIIPCLDIKEGRVVKGIKFVDIIDAGNPVELAAHYAAAGADELVFLDITASAEKRKTLVKLVEDVAKVINIPFTVGGGISELSDIETLLKAGADKVSLNSSIVTNPALITEASKRFGSQAIVAAVDTKFNNGSYEVFVQGGRKATGLEAMAWCRRVTELGAGEILQTSMDKDGTKEGYDTAFLGELTKQVRVPVIASGGAGKMEHFLDAFINTGVEACLAASLFHYGEMTIADLKQYLNKNGVKVRL
ncbi:MAG: imidazole glycerol phosphate synthase subunit HisF [Bacteroidota bacterium]